MKNQKNWKISQKFRVCRLRGRILKSHPCKLNQKSNPHHIQLLQTLPVHTSQMKHHRCPNFVPKQPLLITEGWITLTLWTTLVLFPLSSTFFPRYLQQEKREESTTEHSSSHCYHKTKA